MPATQPTGRRGISATIGWRCSRAVASRRLRPRAAAAPDRRESPRARRACRRWPGVCFRGSAGGGHAPVRRAAAPGASPGRRRAGHGRTRRRSSRSPATNASTGSRSAGSSPSGAASSTSSPRPAASRCGRALRRRGRAGARVLAVHAARPASTHGRDRLSGRGAAPRSRGRQLPPDDEDEIAPVAAGDLVAPIDRAPDLVWQPDDVRSVWQEQELDPVSLKGATELDPFPRGQPFSFEAQRPAIAARGLAEAENELAGFVRSGIRVVVAFPHQGEALRHASTASQRRGATRSSRGDALPPRRRLLFAVSPARRGFVWRELGLVLLPGHAGLPQAAAARRRAARPRAAVVRRPAHRRLRRPRGPRRRQAARLRDEGGRRRHARLPLPRVPRRRPALRAARADRQGLALHRRRREGAGALEARRQGLAEPQDPRARVGPRARGRADRALRAAPAGRGRRLRPRERVARAARGVVPVPRDRRPGSARSRPSRRTSSRRGRWTGSSAATSASARPRSPCAPRSRSPSTAGRCSMLVPDDDPRRAALEHLPRALPRLPGHVEMVSRFRSRPRRSRCSPTSPPARSTSSIGTHRVLSRDVIPKNLGLVIVDEEQRFGVAQKELLRPLRLEVDVLALTATPIPRTLHMSLVGPARHLDHRDAARGPPPDPHARRRVRRGADQGRARARARARRAGVLPAQPRRVDRGGGEKLRQLCPDLRFLVAHGQMGERELEERMHAFLAGDADVLVSTTIIESGLDIPQANTLIVERADPLGLASSTRSAAASAAPTSPRTPTSSIPTRAS